MKIFDELLQREVTRSQFLKMIGVAAVTVFGVHNLISGMNRSISLDESRGSQRVASHGFGSRKFGE